MSARRWVLTVVPVTLAVLMTVLLLPFERATGGATDGVTVERLQEGAVASQGRELGEPIRESRPERSREPLEAPPADSRPAERGPVLVTGRVVDDLGEPVAGAVVTAWPPPGLLSADGRRLRLSGDGWPQQLKELKVRGAEQRAKLAVLYPGEGRFEVRGWTEAERIHLEAHEGQRRCSGTAAVGARGFELRLARIGSVHAVIVHDRATSARAFEVNLVSHRGAPRIALKIARHERKGERAFHGERIPVGRYDLEVRLRDHAAPLLRIESLEVRSNELCSDERLRHIDTRGLCRHLVVRLTLENGKPLPLPAYLDAEVTALDPNGDPLPIQPKMRQSRIELTTSYPYVDLRVDLRRYRDVHLPILDADRTVRVEPE